MQVSEQIVGRNGAKLPWEGGPRSHRILGSLGIFSPAILGLLRRDPAARLSVVSFCRTCREALGGTDARSRAIRHGSVPASLGS